MMNRRNADAVARYEERVEREDQAPRLHDEVPRLLRALKDTYMTIKSM